MSVATVALPDREMAVALMPMPVATRAARTYIHVGTQLHNHTEEVRAEELTNFLRITDVRNNIAQNRIYLQSCQLPVYFSRKNVLINRCAYKPSRTVPRRCRELL